METLSNFMTLSQYCDFNLKRDKSNSAQFARKAKSRIEKGHLVFSILQIPLSVTIAMIAASLGTHYATFVYAVTLMTFILGNLIYLQLICKKTSWGKDYYAYCKELQSSPDFPKERVFDDKSNWL